MTEANFSALNQRIDRLENEISLIKSNPPTMSMLPTIGDCAMPDDENAAVEDAMESKKRPASSGISKTGSNKKATTVPARGRVPAGSKITRSKSLRDDRKAELYTPSFATNNVNNRKNNIEPVDMLVFHDPSGRKVTAKIADTSPTRPAPTTSAGNEFSEVRS